MKRLYYARHGESLVNVRGIFATKLGTKNDLGLTELGQPQAIKSGKDAASKDLKFDVLVVSPLARTLETAKIIAKEVNHPPDCIITSELFLEIQYGELEGTSWQTFWDAGNTYADLGKFSGAETIEDLQQRASKAFGYLQSLSEDTILVVGHSAFGRALGRVINNEPWQDEFTKGVPLPHAEILRLI